MLGWLTKDMIQSCKMKLYSVVLQ